MMTAISEGEKNIYSSSTDLCHYLDWDSDFFGLRIARIQKEHLSTDDMLRVLSWCREEKIDCLYFLAQSSDAETLQRVEEYKFHLADVRVTLEKKVSPENHVIEGAPDYKIRSAQLKDLDDLRQIAGASIQDTRFYFDLRFPRERCNLLYRTWIDVSMKGYADAVLVAEAGSTLSGFITCKLGKPGEGQIGLLGVKPGMKGKGIGVALVKTGLYWFAGQGSEKVLVVTQGRNIHAQRLYQRCGFLICSTQLWYHRWFDLND